MIFVVCAIVIPYEFIHMPAWLLISLVVFATYIFMNVFYNYYKASTLDPGGPPKVFITLFCIPTTQLLQFNYFSR